ncbi:ABC transporter ATP-binding protein [Dongia deserti]|uniref:ABC transporter ATP-binding protein n=1 Tax=Dongia deserti TaxID=2268030 RepID=UPI000E64C9D0|nr:ABC transporter ATP-binding protein [Dongia deserti]
MSTVTVTDAVKKYDAVAALDSVTMTFREGELFGLLGPSGSGKTTLLRAIAGFVSLDRGQVLIDGQNVGGVPVHARNIGMMFQNYALFPHMSVAENVAFGLEVRGRPREEVARRVNEALAMVRLGGLEQRKPKQLSGGQQQRVALARALVTRPKVLLLDEPLGALDKHLRQEMQVELRRIQRQVGITTIFVTHDQEEALTLSDRIAIFNFGRIIQEGAPMEVYERPVTKFAAGFLGEANFLQGRVTAIEPNGLARVALDLGGEALCRLIGGQAGQTVLLALRPEKIKLSTDSQAGTNAVRGKVLDVVFSGNSTTYRVRVGNQVITLFRQNLAQGTVAPGSEVVLSWSPDHLVQVTP